MESLASLYQNHIATLQERTRDALARVNMDYIGPVPERALQLGIEASNINPNGVMDYLHYFRSFKTEFDFGCMR